MSDAAFARTPAPKPAGAALDSPLAQHAVLTLALLVFWWIAYRHTLSLPFLNDDYVFLDRARRTGFGALWLPRDLVFGWWRPWSREFHYWWLDHLLGASESAAHTVNLVLWLGVMNLALALGRRLAGAGLALVAAAVIAALAPWGALLSWVANAQDLWMLLFALLALRLLLARRAWLAALAQLFALASKETAALVPVIAFAALAIAREGGWRERLRRLAPSLAVTLAWLAAHPAVRARLAGHAAGVPEAVERTGWATLLARSALAQVNLEVAPHPDRPWPVVIALGLAGAAVVGALAWRGAAPAAAAQQDAARERAPRAIAYAAWALAGGLPLFAPGVVWHAYYGLLGTIGLWLGLSHLLATRRAAAVGAVVALALLRQAAASTPSWNWGSEWYQLRAGSFVAGIRAALLGVHPTVPPGSRLFFANLPNNIGLLSSDGPALRVWYSDSTLRAGFYSAYEPRRPGDARGADFFFRYDTTSGFAEVKKGAEDLAPALAANPRWRHDHEVLAALLLRAGETEAAIVEYEKLAAAFPADEFYTLYAGVLFESLGRAADAEQRYARIAPAMGGMRNVREAAAELLRDLRANPARTPPP